MLKSLSSSQNFDLYKSRKRNDESLLECTCEVCDKEGVAVYNLKTHMRTTHGCFDVFFMPHEVSWYVPVGLVRPTHLIVKCVITQLL